MHKRFSFFLFMLITIFALTGCSSIVNKVLKKESPEAIIQKAMNAYQDVQSVEVTIDESAGEYQDEAIMVIDFENDESNVWLEGNDLLLYTKDDQVKAEYQNEAVDTAVVDDSISNLILNRVESQRTPYDLLSTFDEEFYEEFQVGKEDNLFIFTFDGSDEAKERLGKILLYYDISGGTDLKEEEFSDVDIDVSDLDISFVIDSSTYLLQQINHDVTFNADGNTNHIQIVHRYNKYDAIDDIVKMDFEENVVDSDDSNATDVSDQDRSDLEKEASEYVDALILATVFQDADGFIEKAPDSMSDEDKKSEAEMQADFFKEIYIENTKNNMAGVDFKEEDIEKLGDAFMEALSTTDYEVVGAEANDDEQILVTVSIEGIDDQAVYEKTEDKLTEYVNEGELDQEELVAKNLEILTKNYKNVDTLMDPIEVDVNVAVDNGQYLVMQQDEFLEGFVR